MRVLVLTTNVAADLLTDGLRGEGMVCDVARDLDDLASIAALSGPYDVVVLDLVSLDLAAHRAIRALRRSGGTLPVLAVCARLESGDEESALHSGADDVLRQPYRLPVLHARIQALVRRARGYASARLSCGNVVLDQEAHAVLVDGRRVPLTAREFDFLQIMMLHKGVLLTKERFLNGLYADTEAPDLKVVDVFVCKLRRKLAADRSRQAAARDRRLAWSDPLTELPNRRHFLARMAEAHVGRPLPAARGRLVQRLTAP